MKEETILNSGPAFPFDIKDSEGGHRWAQGMWLRDYFAAKAMQTLTGRDEVWVAQKA